MRVEPCSLTGSAPRRMVPPISAISFCSGSRSITGNGVSMSNSVELAPSIPATWRGRPAPAPRPPPAKPRAGVLAPAREPGGADLALDPAASEAARDQDPADVLEPRGDGRISDLLGV